MRGSAGRFGYMSPMLAIEELTASTCRWPLAEFERGVFLYCGEAVDPSRIGSMRCSYCLSHKGAAYRPATAPGRPSSPPHWGIPRRGVSPSLTDNVF
jgi:hypothetical protein